MTREARVIAHAVAIAGIAACAGKVPTSSPAEPPRALITEPEPSHEAEVPTEDAWVVDVGRGDAGAPSPPPRTPACVASLEELARHARRDVPCKTAADCVAASACELRVAVGANSDERRLRALEQRARTDCEAACASPAGVVATCDMRGPPAIGGGHVPRFCSGHVVGAACSPPYVIDSRGERRYKPECF